MATTVPDLRAGALFDMTGKVVVVTGGATGLGMMTATAYVQNNAKRVYICSRKMKNLEAAATTLNGIRKDVCRPIEADLTTAKGCKQLADQLAQRESKLHVLVNNSGVSFAAPLHDTDEQRGWDRVMNVNVKSIFYLTVALLPLLERDSTIDSPASVINISSMYATLPLPNMPSTKPGHGAWSYLASKAAVSHLTRALAIHLKPKHVNVNAIAPGFYPSNMTTHTSANVYDRSHPAGRQGTPQDMAGPTLLLSGRGGAHLSGIVLLTDGASTLQDFNSAPPDIAKLWLPQGWMKNKENLQATSKAKAKL